LWADKSLDRVRDRCTDFSGPGITPGIPCSRAFYKYLFGHHD
jgi:hypothetical protein